MTRDGVANLKQMQKVLKIKNVLVSQPQPAIIEKAPYYEMAKNQGINITYIPFISVVGVSLKEFRSQRVEILEHTAVIFTSRTTIDHFFRICEEARITIPETMKYFCNSEAIALYLQKYIVYRKRKIFFANGTLPSLSELIVKHKDERYLLTMAEPHKPELPNMLADLKVKFDSVVLANTVGTDVSQVKPADYDLMVFYSPLEISTLVSTLGSTNLPPIATFGDNTLKMAHEYGLEVNAMAPTKTAPSMVMAVNNYISRVNAGEQVEPIAIDENCQIHAFIKEQEAKPVKKVRAKKDTPSQPKQ